VVASLDGLLARAALDALAQVARFMYDRLLEELVFLSSFASVRWAAPVAKIVVGLKSWGAAGGPRGISLNVDLSNAFFVACLGCLGCLVRVVERVGELGRLFLCALKLDASPFKMYSMVGLTRPSQFSIGDAERDTDLHGDLDRERCRRVGLAVGGRRPGPPFAGVAVGGAPFEGPPAKSWCLELVSIDITRSNCLTCLRDHIVGLPGGIRSVRERSIPVLRFGRSLRLRLCMCLSYVSVCVFCFSFLTPVT